MVIVRSILLFVLSGLLEIGGGYLVWQSVREGKPYYYGILGALALIGYGFVATMQRAGFARVFATYGGIFIAMSIILWSMKFDQFKPDKYDIIGSNVSIVGACIIYYAPRK